MKGIRSLGPNPICRRGGFSGGIKKRTNRFVKLTQQRRHASVMLSLFPLSTWR